MASGKRASMREGPLADLFRKTEQAAEQAHEDRVEEQHGVRAEGPVRAARLEEMDGRPGQAAELERLRDDHPVASALDQPAQCRASSNLRRG